MSRPTGITKKSDHAHALWGYDALHAIPKSVFATVAWHLANRISATCDQPGAAESSFLDELAALNACGVIDDAQFKVSAKAIRSTTAKAEAR